MKNLPEIKFNDAFPKDYTREACGFIPQYFQTAMGEEDTLKHLVDVGYAMTAGMRPNWHHHAESVLTETGEYTYPRDPTLLPLVTVSHGEERFYLYDYGLAAYRQSPKHEPEFCRLD